MRSESIARMSLTLLMLYLFSMATSFSITFRYFGIGVICFTALLWLVIRTARGWKWHHTPLDAVFPMWGIAFAISILANDETWRRSFIALWYMGLYLGIWTVMSDTLANKGIRRDVIVDAFLLASVMIIFFGYLQLWYIRLSFLTTARRPFSILGNANLLGAYLMVLLLLISGRLWGLKDRSGRKALWLYFGLSAFLLIATYSRGAWVAVAAGFGLLAFFRYRDSGGMESLKLRERLRENRRTTLIVGIMATVVVCILTVMIAQSLSRPGRTVSRRTILWEAAIEAFQERPITGHGLYTYGQQYMRLESIPPETPHNHAHSLPLHIAAELGVIGLIILAITGLVLYRAIAKNCMLAPTQERGLIYGSVAAILGMTVHQLIDMPVQFLTIAILGMGTLALAATPVNPVLINSGRQRIIRLTATAGLWLILTVTGVWSVSIMSDFQRIREMPFGVNGTGDYRAAAEAMQAVVDADPGLTWYSNQQGFLYGLAAYEGDLSAIEPAIAAYERFLDTDPQNAIVLVNVAALQWQGDQKEAALETMQQAVDAAPKAWQFWFQLGLYAEELGDIELAETSYTNAINDPSYLLPEWQETPLRQRIHDTLPPTEFIQATIALSENAFSPGINLDSVYAELGFKPEKKTLPLILQTLIMLEMDNPDVATGLLDEARPLVASEVHLLWYTLAEWRVSLATGATDEADESLVELQDAIEIEYDERDYAKGIIIPYLQFQRTAIPRQFLPQVFYPAIDPALMYLIRAKYPEVIDSN